ncbi:MAG TPA: hypothetical protein VEO56_14735 [Bacteroidota bacterium]|nr:hypothetical protein [Bacteroidota bacterium]
MLTREFHNIRKIFAGMRLAVLALLVAGCASSSSELTQLEKEKLNPALRRLVLKEVVNPWDYDVRLSPSGETLYGITVRTDNVEELRGAGFTVTSSFGEIAVLHVTLDELRELVKLPSVHSVANGVRNAPR